MVTELMECKDCEKRWPIGGSGDKCPYCLSLRVVVFGDEEDVETLARDQKHEFSGDGEKRGLGSSTKGA